MLDLNHLPKTGNGNIDYFYNTGNSGITTSCWQTWEKPKGIGTIVITCIGGGGGGRSGDNSTSSGAGGGGGGSGGFSRLIIPAMVLPDVLYVTVGSGGAGGIGTAVNGDVGMGTVGTGSYVSIAPSTDAIYVACYANGGGTSVTFSSGGSVGGEAAAVAIRQNALMSGLGQFVSFAGQRGRDGSSGVVQEIIYPTTGLLLSGGAAGGSSGTNARNGGAVVVPTQTSFSLISTRNGGVAPNGNGADGISISQPLMSTGGSGGATNSDTGRSRGGNGGFGSGGGGGGTAVAPTFSGSGGNGGDGLVIIQTF